jgi:hypothetical protein
MPSETGGCSNCIALVLAAAAAIMSVPGQAGDTWQELQRLLSTIAPAGAAMAGAIGHDPQFLTPP